MFIFHTQLLRLRKQKVHLRQKILRVRRGREVGLKGWAESMGVHGKKVRCTKERDGGIKLEREKRRKEEKV